MEEGVKDINDENNEIYDEVKEAEYLDDTSLVDVEEGVNYKKDENNENNDQEKYV